LLVVCAIKEWPAHKLQIDSSKIEMVLIQFTGSNRNIGQWVER
jgi:hypothetical protein